jgi:hypothetical protein
MKFLLAAFMLSATLAVHSLSCTAADPVETKPLILAHYMPWYTANAAGNQWGWHWTMNHFDPQKQINNRRPIASHFYPVIGPYDSSHQHVLEYHLLLMKISGIDGVVVDWYGLKDHFDYSALHESTKRLAELVQRFEMKFVICYEDQTINALVQASKVTPDQRVKHAVQEIDWLVDNWFKLPNYVKIDGKPVLLSFGMSGLSNAEWTSCISQLSAPIAYFSEHEKRDAAIGAFDWPIPDQGLKAISGFRERSNSWKLSIPVAFPRFVDIYAEAGVNAGYAKIDDDRGKTFQNNLEQALQSNSALIQIATWNDWGEGTQIEPSVEFGNRDLEVVQRSRRKYLDKSFAGQASDLEIPLKLYQLRQSSSAQQLGALDAIASLIAHGELKQADTLLKNLMR